MNHVSIEDRHRADYVLDRGEWQATCRLCGFKVNDPSRRQAASQFRTHIRDEAEAARSAVTVIDLRVPTVPVAAGHHDGRVAGTVDRAAPRASKEPR
jgi:hypothetical protein